MVIANSRCLLRGTLGVWAILCGASTVFAQSVDGPIVDESFGHETHSSQTPTLDLNAPLDREASIEFDPLLIGDGILAQQEASVGQGSFVGDENVLGDRAGIEVLNGQADLGTGELVPVIPSDQVIMDSTTIDANTAGVITEQVDALEPPPVTFDDWLGYNASQSQTTWMADDDFGMFSIQSFPTLELDEDSALTFGYGFHFLEGPIEPDVRPRLFDFEMAYHSRGKFSSSLMLDFKFGVGAFSDFEGSARKGVRFPGHAVFYGTHTPHFASVLGVEVLDRDDISLLPVFGWVVQPSSNVIWELIFPRPKLRMRVNSNQAFYVSGELGGGTWAIERSASIRDNMTYRDLRVLCGLMTFGEESESVLELGVAFDRELEYRTGVTSPPLGTAFLLRCHKHY